MKISRRQSLAAGAAATGWAMIPGKVMGANERVNIAAIGIGQRGPAIMHWPSCISEGSTCSEMALSLDLLPRLQKSVVRLCRAPS